MCGIVAYIGNSNVTLCTSAFLQELILQSQVRGKVGTGIVTRKTGGYSNIIKQAVSAQEFIKNGHAKFLHEKEYNLLLAHVRQRSSGKINNRSSQPFGSQINGKWVFLAHNGTITNKKQVEKEFQISEANTDSEMILHAITYTVRKTGCSMEDAIKQVVKRLNGTFACVLLNPINNTVYCWRNSARPLVVFDTRSTPVGGRTIASTKQIFQKAWEKRGFENFIPTELLDSFELKPMRLYKCGLDMEFTHVADMTTDFPYKEKPAWGKWANFGYHKSRSYWSRDEDILYDNVDENLNINPRHNNILGPAILQTIIQLDNDQLLEEAIWAIEEKELEDIPYNREYYKALYDQIVSRGLMIQFESLLDKYGIFMGG